MGTLLLTKRSEPKKRKLSCDYTCHNHKWQVKMKQKYIDGRFGLLGVLPSRGERVNITTMTNLGIGEIDIIVSEPEAKQLLERDEKIFDFIYELARKFPDQFENVFYNEENDIKP